MLELFKNKLAPTTSEACRKILADLDSKKRGLQTTLARIRTSIGENELTISQAEDAIASGSDEWAALNAARADVTKLREQAGGLHSEINALEPLIAKARGRLEQAEEAETAMERRELAERYEAAMEKFSERLLSAMEAGDECDALRNEAVTRFPSRLVPSCFAFEPWRRLRVANAWFQRLAEALPRAMSSKAYAFLEKVDSVRVERLRTEQVRTIQFRQQHQAFIDSMMWPKSSNPALGGPRPPTRRQVA